MRPGPCKSQLMIQLFFVGSPNMFNLYTSIQKETIQEAVSWYTTNPIKSPLSDPTFRRKAVGEEFKI